MARSQIRFDGKGTFDEWGLALISLDAGTPKAKTDYLPIAGASGFLDRTEALSGGINYEARDVTATFRKDHRDRLSAVATRTRLSEALHGRRVRIELPDYPGAFLMGRVGLSFSFEPSHLLRVTAKMHCDPFVYSGSSSAELRPTEPVASSGLIAHPHPDFALGCGVLRARYARESAYWTPSARAISVYSAGTANLLDASQARVLLLGAERSPSNQYRYMRSGVMRMDGERVSVGACAKAWTQRVSVMVDGASDWAIGDKPSFPFTGGELYLTAFVTGRVKSVGTDPSDGNHLAGITLTVEDAFGRLGSDGRRSGGSSRSERYVPKAGETMVDRAVTVRVDGPFNLVRLDVEWLEASEMGVAFMLSEQRPAAWAASDVRRRRIGLPGTVQTTADGGSDEVELTAVGSKLVKRTYQTSEPHVARPLASPREAAFQAMEWFETGSAASVCACCHNSAGSPMALLSVEAVSYPMATARLDNGSMPATPTLTCSSPVVVSDGGGASVTPPGKSQLVPITVRQGGTDLRYSVVGSGSARLEWPRGVL